MAGRNDRADELLGIAEEAYVYLFPLVLMDVTRRVSVSLPAGARPGFGPMNVFTHLRAFPPGDFREVVRPNYDTLYSILWFDLRDEPVVVSVPSTDGRYYMLPMLDMWTDVFAVVGSRTTGAAEGHYALASPGWDGELPSGTERIDAPTPVGWIVGRTQTNGPADYEAVHAIQNGFVATPLSRWPHEPAAVNGPPEPGVDISIAPLDHVLALSGTEFIAYGADLMRLHRPHLVDQPVLARMSRLGMQPGARFNAEDAAPEILAAIEQAPAAAQQRMVSAEPRLSPLVNGWAMATYGMGVYGTDYLRRAVVAKVGLGANLPADAIYPVMYLDASGNAPTGDHDYVLHFDRDALPPADAFWSVTMYDGDGFPVPNAIDRYAIGDRDPLRFNNDGSLDLFIQHDDPGNERRDNWLPSPRGPIGITLRLYSPRPEALDGSWAPPPLNPA